MRAEVGTYHKEGAEQTMVAAAEVEVTFDQPFPEGVTPVVIAQNQSSATTAAPVSVQVRDVTNTGFKVKLQAQNNNTLSVRSMYLRYIAITPGEAPLTATKKISAGIGAEPVGGTTNREVYFTLGADTLSLIEPYLLANSQTHNLDYAMVMRRYSVLTEEQTRAEEGGEVTTRTVTRGIKVRRQMDASVTFDTKNENRYNVDGDYIGWIAISNIDLTDGIRQVGMTPPMQVQVVGRTICPSNPDACIYDISGQRVPAFTVLTPGIYIVNDGLRTTKVAVR